MHRVAELHNRAMGMADRAAEALRLGNTTEHLSFTRDAYRLEAEAAMLVAPHSELEPSRSILLRSAATLALECGELRSAEQLIATALSGNPPDEIANELRDLLEDVYFHRHLSLRGVKLAPGEVQMSMVGAAVGFGITRSNAFLQRVKDLERLLFRTAERRLGRDFREGGRVEKDLADKFEMYMSVPRAASFAVTLKLGQVTQMELFGPTFAEETMQEVLRTIELVSVGNLAEIEKAVPDEPYRINLLGLVQRLSPDGEDIKTVGFTTVTHEKEYRVALSKPRRELREEISPKRNQQQSIPDASVPLREAEEIIGVLLEADATSASQGIIEIVDDSGRAHKVSVPRGMMSDIVKPMFEERVVVTGKRKEKTIELSTIDLAEKPKPSH